MYDTKTMTPFGGPSFEGCSMAVNDTRDPGHGKQLVMLSRDADLGTRNRGGG